MKNVRVKNDRVGQQKKRGSSYLYYGLSEDYPPLNNIQFILPAENFTELKTYVISGPVISNFH